MTSRLQRRLVQLSLFRKRIGRRQRHRAGPVRGQAARDASGFADRTSRDDSGTGQRRTDRLGVVVCRDGDQPWTRSACRDECHRDAAGDGAALVGAGVAGRVLRPRDRELQSGKPRARIRGIRRRHGSRAERRRLREHGAGHRDRRGRRQQESSAATTTRGVRHSPTLSFAGPMEGRFLDRAQQHRPMDAARRRGRRHIDLSRDDGASWTRLIDEAENVGFYDWTGNGDETSRARIRVSSVTRPSSPRPHSLFYREPLRSAGSAVLDEQHAELRPHQEPPSASAGDLDKTDSEKTQSSSCGDHRHHELVSAAVRTWGRWRAIRTPAIDISILT